MKSRQSRFFGSAIFRHALIFAVIFIVLQVSIIVFISSYSQYSLTRQREMNMEHILHLCEETMNGETAATDRTLKYLLTQDAYLRLLSSPQDNVSYHAAYELGRIIEASSFSDTIGVTYVIADTGGQVLVEHRDAGFSYAALQDVQTMLSDIGKRSTDRDSGWFLTPAADSWYLCHCYISEDITASAFLDVSRLWSRLLEENRMLEVRSDDISLLIGSKGLLKALPGEGLPGGDTQPVLLQTEKAALTLGMYMPDSSWGDNSTMPTMIVLSSLLALLFVLVMVIYLYREYNRPISELEAVTHSIEEGDYESRAALSCRNSELQNLASSFNSMLDMIMQLKIEQYESIIRRQDIELKYYYMQIRPHFYLNALSSMQSMCLRGENERVSEYIMALSKNIRYMFNAGFKLVPLREELEHIDDYIRCQEILLPGCVFSYIDVTPPAGDWMVPQMMVHTFVENVYKHVVAADRIVTLLVRAEIVPDPAVPGSDALRLIIEDDGEGFPEEILQALSSGNPDDPVLKNCVGLMNVRMTLSLMYGRDDLLFIKNNGSAGSKVRIVVPKETVTREEAPHETADRG